MKVAWRSIFSWSFKLVVVLIIGVSIWGGIYVYDKGFTRKWRAQLQEEFRKRGVELSVQRLTLDPFQGLMAKGVRIYDYEDTDSVLAVISRIRVEVNWIQFILGQPSLNAIDLRDADLAIPIDPTDSNSPRVEIKGFQARIFFPGQRIEVSQAEGEMFGVRVSLKGSLIKPENYRPAVGEPDAEELANRIAWFELIRREVERFDFAGGPPRLEMEFHGDVSQLENIRVKATLRGEGFTFNGQPVRELFAVVEARDRRIELKRLILEDARGTLSAQATFEPAMGELDYELHSNADLLALAGEFIALPLLAEIRLESTPEIEVLGQSRFGEDPAHRFLGRMEWGRFTVRAVPFERLMTEFSWTPDRWLLRNLRLVHETGQLTGQFLQNPGEARFRLQSSLNPSRLKPLFDGPTADLISDFDFEEMPLLRLEGRGPSFRLEDLQFEGQFDFGRTTIRGYPLQSARIPFASQNGSLSYPGFQIQREEGWATGTLSYDFNTKFVEFKDIRSNLNPYEVAHWIDPQLARDLAPYRFASPPELLLEGVVDSDAGQGTDLTVTLLNPVDMEYDFLGQTLPFEEVNGRVLIGHFRVQLQEVSASLFDGTVFGRADIRLEGEDRGYSAVVRVDEVDFQEVTRLYFDFDEAEGALSGLYEFAGLDDDPRTMSGEGYMELLRGDVFAIPVLGPLSGIIDEFLPGIGYSRARQATANFKVERGFAFTEDFEVNAENFALSGGGRLGFVDDDIDFTIRVNARGVPGTILFPVSKLFEYVSHGSLSNPEWKPKRLPAL